MNPQDFAQEKIEKGSWIVMDDITLYVLIHAEIAVSLYIYFCPLFYGWHVGRSRAFHTAVVRAWIIFE